MACSLSTSSGVSQNSGTSAEAGAASASEAAPSHSPATASRSRRRSMVLMVTGRTISANCYAEGMAPMTAAIRCADGETVCDWVYDVTGNETLSEGSALFIGVPLALLGLLVL